MRVRDAALDVGDVLEDADESHRVTRIERPKNTVARSRVDGAARGMTASVLIHRAQPSHPTHTRPA
jgi:hypothetical protein